MATIRGRSSGVLPAATAAAALIVVSAMQTLSVRAA
jgi:hypothetical protein